MFSGTQKQKGGVTMNRFSNSGWVTPLLIVITLLLAAIALKPAAQPQPVMAQQPVVNVSC
jgi:hypothetical protein